MSYGVGADAPPVVSSGAKAPVSCWLVGADAPPVVGFHGLRMRGMPICTKRCYVVVGFLGLVWTNNQQPHGPFPWPLAAFPYQSPCEPTTKARSAVNQQPAWVRPMLMGYRHHPHPM